MDLVKYARTQCEPAKKSAPLRRAERYDVDAMCDVSWVTRSLFVRLPPGTTNFDDSREVETAGRSSAIRRPSIRFQSWSRRIIIGPALFVLALVWFLIALGIILPIWAIIDAASHSSAAFHAARSSKATWIVVIITFTVLFDVGGLALSIFYLAVTRPRIRQFEVR